MDNQLPTLEGYNVIHVDMQETPVPSDLVVINTTLREKARHDKLTGECIIATFIFPDGMTSFAHYYPA